ncbi:pyridoxamine 5' [Daphnia sinensis]|uniref:pyridoxal 5'-phosphate synthase n=1 Tax=Daphnia sinensis TaxID=1820382 RepID=A0AAD5PKH8_9CRUS|nr:pyridoxamine 5' [Daphnia sinensis]
MKTSIAHLRQDYQLQSLDIADVDPNPFVQFAKWFEDTIKAEILEPNAMTLSTATPEGKPSSRIVLLKGLEFHHPELQTGGFVFYTNYNSQKGEEMAANPHVSLCFNWLDLQRQVRIEGTVSKVSADISTEYFNSRPKLSRIGAWVSNQSQVVPDRAYLENRFKELSEKYEDTEGVPRPAHWGGYIVKPTLIEFWQGRRSRLHDRICYTKLEGSEEWKIERLAP